MSVSNQFRASAALNLLHIATRGETLERLHRVIESEISASLRRLEEASKTENSDFLEFATDEECQSTEELLGLAFVAAQSFITSIRTEVTDVAEMSRQFGIRFTFFSDPKAIDTLKLASPLTVAPQFSVVEAIHAVGNYWKHSEEWPTQEVVSGRWRRQAWDMASMRGNEKRTAEIVTSLGMTLGSTGNLRTAAEALGVTEYNDLRPIRRTLQNWAFDLKIKVANDLAAAPQLTP